MKIPQLFVKVGNNRFIPVSHPIKNKPLYFWDDQSKEIKPAEDALKIKVISGHSFLVV